MILVAKLTLAVIFALLSFAGVYALSYAVCGEVTPQARQLAVIVFAFYVGRIYETDRLDDVG